MGRRKLELFYPNDNNKSSSKADHNDDDYHYYDAEDKDKYTDNAQKVLTL